jgi:hypothetical protein
MYVVGGFSDLKPEVSFHEITGLLERVSVLRQSAVSLEDEFGHERFLAKDQRLLGYAGQGRAVAGGVMGVESFHDFEFVCHY